MADQIILTRASFEHMTRRTRLDDGRWQTVCACGWTSAPRENYDQLGWACDRAEKIRAQQRREDGCGMTFERTFRRDDAVLAYGSQKGWFVRISRASGYAVVDMDLRGGYVTVPLAELTHAPVEVVGQVPPKPPTVCPDCGAVLERTVAERYVARSDGGRRLKEVAVVACSGCEFVEEVKH